jgi:hypothetical protein
MIPEFPVTRICIPHSIRKNNLIAGKAREFINALA